MKCKNMMMIVCLSFCCAVSQASANDLMRNFGDLKNHLKLPSQKFGTASLSNADIASGLKDALRVGSEHVVVQLGTSNGFQADPNIHIPLPKNLKRVKSTLSKVGQSRVMDDLELKLNRAAEVATPKARKIFGAAIRGMSFNDARNIFNGPDDAATTYFKGKMSAPLSTEMQPVITHALAQVGAIQAYDRVMGKYKALPFVPDVSADLTKHVLDLALNGIFYYMAIEEAAIRKDPVKRTTDILKKVFGH